MSLLPNSIELRQRKERLAAAIYEKRIREERRRQAEPDGGLLEFIRYFWHILEPATEFVEGWAVECLCAHLEAITRGDTVVLQGEERPLNRFLANVPPGFMKSLLVNVFWPAWEWGPQELPHLRYVAFSYAADLTQRDNKKFRDLICCVEYKQLWGHVFKVTGDGMVRVQNDKTGFKFASSIGGVGTGERGDRVLCLPGNEKLLTDQGWLPIGDIVEKRLCVKIAGLDNETNQVVWQDIEAYERNPGNDIIEVECDQGSFRCTGDHPVFVQGRGYARAESLASGDKVVGTGRNFGMPSLQDGDQTQGVASSEILQQGMSVCQSRRIHETTSHEAVCDLRRAGLSPTRASEEKQERSLLQSQVQGSRPNRCWKFPVQRWVNRVVLRVLREDASALSKRGKTRKVLFDILLNKALLEGIWKAPEGTYLQVLRCTVQAHVSWLHVLWEKMRRYCAFSPHEGIWQWPVYARSSGAAVPSGMVAVVQSGNPSAGRKSLSAMRVSFREEQFAPCASYRLCEREPQSRQSDHAVQALPWKNARFEETAGQVETRTVQSVKACGREDVVYNVRVTPCHNYFANGILVHNCDDVHKVKVSESDEVRKGVVDWVREGMSNRLNSLAKSVIVAIMQRTHHEDTSGVLISEYADEYCVLIIPMEYEANRHFTSLEGWEDPRQYDGELAWPERYATRELASFKRNPYLWSGQYQQNPSPRGGGILKEDWWQVYEVPPSGTYDFEPDFVLASLDTAFTEDTQNDYSALTVWYVYDEPKTKRRRIVLVDAWKKRLELHGVDVERTQGESEASYMRRAQAAWGLCEWVAHTCTRRRVHQLIVENKSRGHDVVKELKRLYGDRTWGVTAENLAGGDKISRVHSVVDLFTDGMIYAPGEWMCAEHGVGSCKTCPDDSKVLRWRDWAAMVIKDCSDFPRGAHDDIVDTVSMALRYLRNNGIAIRRTERELYDSEAAMYQRPQKSLYPV